MKPSVIIVVCVLAIAGYLGYNHFMKGGEDTNEKNIRTSFQALSVAIASRNPNVVKNLLSPTFSDKKISNKEFIKVLTLPRKSYITNITKVTFQGDLGSISYTRSETRGTGDPIKNYKVIGETWIKDKNNPNVWRLHRLAKKDKWFRTTETPQKKVVVEAKPDKDEPVLGSLEKGKIVALSMQEGGRYSPIGRRDPFRPLIAMAGEEIAGQANCDPERPREHLENFDLLSLKLTGVIITEEKPVALVRAPDGKGYTIQIDMYLGRMCGKVIGIDAAFMTVREQKQPPGALPGVFEPVKTILKLRHEEG